MGQTGAWVAIEPIRTGPGTGSGAEGRAGAEGQGLAPRAKGWRRGPRAGAEGRGLAPGGRDRPASR